jgi:hypothetical protein
MFPSELCRLVENFCAPWVVDIQDAWQRTARQLDPGELPPASLIETLQAEWTASWYQDESIERVCLTNLASWENQVVPAINQDPSLVHRIVVKWFSHPGYKQLAKHVASLPDRSLTCWLLEHGLMKSTRNPIVAQALGYIVGFLYGLDGLVWQALVLHVFNCRWLGERQWDIHVWQQVLVGMEVCATRPGEMVTVEGLMRFDGLRALCLEEKKRGSPTTGAATSKVWDITALIQQFGSMMSLVGRGILSQVSRATYRALWHMGVVIPSCRIHLANFESSTSARERISLLIQQLKKYKVKLVRLHCVITCNHPVISRHENWEQLVPELIKHGVKELVCESQHPLCGFIFQAGLSLLNPTIRILRLTLGSLCLPQHHREAWILIHKVPEIELVHEVNVVEEPVRPLGKMKIRNYGLRAFFFFLTRLDTLQDATVRSASRVENLTLSLIIRVAKLFAKERKKTLSELQAEHLEKARQCAWNVRAQMQASVATRFPNLTRPLEIRVLDGCAAAEKDA